MSNREIVIMLVEPHEGNEAGEVRIYRDELPEGAVIKGEEGGSGNAADVSRMNKAQLIAFLEEAGSELTGSETKAELLAIANS